jgi:hypothetical protein
MKSIATEAMEMQPWSRRLLNVTSTRSTGAKAAPFKMFKIQAREQTAGKLGKGAIYEKIA